MFKKRGNVSEIFGLKKRSNKNLYMLQFFNVNNSITPFAIPCFRGNALLNIAPGRRMVCIFYLLGFLPSSCSKKPNPNIDYPTMNYPWYNFSESHIGWIILGTIIIPWIIYGLISTVKYPPHLRELIFLKSYYITIPKYLNQS